MPASITAIVAAAGELAACAPAASSSTCALVPVATTASAVSLTTMRRRKARSRVLRKSGMVRDYITRVVSSSPSMHHTAADVMTMVRGDLIAGVIAVVLCTVGVGMLLLGAFTAKAGRRSFL